MLGCAGAVALAGAAAAAPPDWSGLYAGIHGGGVWGGVSVTDTNGGVDPGPFTYSASGLFGGATAGANMQFGGLVAGVEGDIGYMGLQGHSTIGSAHSDPYYQNLDLKGGAYGDLTGRAGVAFGQLLVYGKGGLAFYSGQATQATTFPGYVTTPTGLFTGWTAGVGVESHLSPSMSVKLEYLHFDFGSQSGAQTSTYDPPVGYVYENSTKLNADSVKIGLNWEFGK